MNEPQAIQTAEIARTPEAIAEETRAMSFNDAEMRLAEALLGAATAAPESESDPGADPNTDVAAAAGNAPVGEVGNVGVPGTQPQDAESGLPGPVVQNPLDFAPISDAIKSGFESIKQDLAPPPAEAQPSVAPPAEEPPAFPDQEKFLEQFADNPVDAIKRIASAIAQNEIAEYKRRTEAELAPMRQIAEAEAKRATVRNTATGFFTNPEFPDAMEMGEEIINAINQNRMSHDDPLSYERMYNKIKMDRLSQNKPLEAYLSDKESLAQLMADPRVREPLIENYLKEVASGGKPAVISQGNLPNATPPKTPNTLDDAAAMLLSRFG